MTYEAPSAPLDQSHECYQRARSETAVRQPAIELTDMGSIWTDSSPGPSAGAVGAEGLTASQIAARTSVSPEMLSSAKPIAGGYRVEHRPFNGPRHPS